MTKASVDEQAPTTSVIRFSTKIAKISEQARKEKKQALWISSVISLFTIFPFWFVGYCILRESEQAALFVVCFAIAVGIGTEIYRKVNDKISGRWMMSILDLRVNTASSITTEATSAHSNGVLELDELYVNYIRNIKKPS